MSGWEAAIGDPLARWLEGAPLEVPAGIAPLFEAVDVADERLSKLTANQKALLVALKVAAEHATARESARSLLERLARLHAWQEPGSTYTAFYLTALGVLAERGRTFGWVEEAEVAEMAIRAHLDLWALCAVRVPGRRGVVAMPPGIRTGTGRHEAIELLLGELAGLDPNDVPMQPGWWWRADNARRRSTVSAVRAALGGQMGALGPDPVIRAWINQRSFESGRQIVQRLLESRLGTAHEMVVVVRSGPDQGATSVGAAMEIPAGADNPRPYTRVLPGRAPEVIAARIDGRDVIATEKWRPSLAGDVVTVVMVGERRSADGVREAFAEAGSLALPPDAASLGIWLRLDGRGVRLSGETPVSRRKLPWELGPEPGQDGTPSAARTLTPAQWAKAEEQAERVRGLIAERRLEQATTISRRLLARLEGRLTS